MALKKYSEEKKLSPTSPINRSSKPKSPIAEQYRNIRTNVEFAAIDTNIRSLMVTSANPSEGKTTTTANLAVVLPSKVKSITNRCRNA